MTEAGSSLGRAPESGRRAHDERPGIQAAGAPAPLRSIDRPIDASRAMRRLRNDVLIAFTIKIVAIFVLAWAFFGTDHRPRIDPQDLFLTSAAHAPADR